MKADMASARRTVADAIFCDPARQGSAALVSEDGSRMSYGELRLATARLAGHVGVLGLPPDGRIALVSPRGSDGVLAFLGGSSVAACCPLNPAMKANEFAAAFEAMRIDAVLLGSVASAAEQVAMRRGLPVVRFAGDGSAAVASQGRLRFRDEVASPPGTALLMQTSGTTSAPKLVPLTHANILAAAQGIVDFFALGPADLCLSPMPLHHVHGLISAAISSLLAGSAICCATTFSPGGFDRMLGALEPTWFTSSPAMHQAMLDFYRREGRRSAGSRLRFFRSSSAPLPAAAIADLEALFSAPLTETYGLTESASMICANPLPPGRRKPGSVGIAVGAELRVVDKNGRDLPAGSPGEIVLRGPSVIRRYLGLPGGGASSFFGDWLRTGDLGTLDGDGYLSVVGRTKELIKRGGLSVYPAEIDNVLVSHPDLVEAITFSVPHPTLGEELVAAVVPVSGAAFDEAMLKAFVAERLSTYKVPAVILAVPSLPKNETGKVLRRMMSGHFASLLAPRNEAPAGPVETGVLALWREILGRIDFGVGDNLLLLGADPLRAAEVATAAKARLAIELAPKTMLAAPTVRSIARGVESKDIPA